MNYLLSEFSNSLSFVNSWAFNIINNIQQYIKKYQFEYNLQKTFLLTIPFQLTYLQFLQNISHFLLYFKSNKSNDTWYAINEIVHFLHFWCQIKFQLNNDLEFFLFHIFLVLFFITMSNSNMSDCVDDNLI